MTPIAMQAWESIKGAVDCVLTLTVCSVFTVAGSAVIHNMKQSAQWGKHWRLVASVDETEVTSLALPIAEELTNISLGISAKHLACGWIFSDLFLSSMLCVYTGCSRFGPGWRNVLYNDLGQCGQNVFKGTPSQRAWLMETTNTGNSKVCPQGHFSGKFCSGP